jgi:hypothetical protein
MADEKSYKKTAGEKKKKTGSKISNTEWGMLIGILGVIDAIQVGLDLIGIPFLASLGTIANRFIDVAVAFALPTYLYLRGVNMKQAKIIGSLMLTFFFEEIPAVDALPLWSADGAYIFLVTKAEEKIKEKTEIDAEKAIAAAKTKTATETTSSENEAAAETRETEKQEGDNNGENKNEEETEGEEKSAGEEEREEKDTEKTPGEEKLKEDEEKKKTSAQSSGVGTGSERGKETVIHSNQNPNQPNLRNATDEKESEAEESTRFRSNLLDLSLSYGERKKQLEKEKQKNNEDDQKLAA